MMYTLIITTAIKANVFPILLSVTFILKMHTDTCTYHKCEYYPKTKKHKHIQFSRFPFIAIRPER
jgi:hypothetical protein